MITHGLVIRPHWLEQFFAGRKRWEVRSRSTQRRGPIALIGSGTGCILGVATLTGVQGPLDVPAFDRAVARGDLVGTEQAALGYPKAYGWQLDQVHPLKAPVRYDHPQGAVIWVCLNEPIRRAILDQVGLMGY